MYNAKCLMRNVCKLTERETSHRARLRIDKKWDLLYQRTLF